MAGESFTVITSVVGVRLAFNSLRALIASTAYHPHTASSNNQSKGRGQAAAAGAAQIIGEHKAIEEKG